MNTNNEMKTDALMSIKDADSVATKLIGKKSTYLLKNTLHDYITAVLSSPSKVNLVKGGSGSGKTVGAVELARYFTNNGFKVTVVRPTNDCFWFMRSYEGLDVNGVTAEAMRELINSDDKSFWIVENWDVFNEMQKDFIKKNIAEFNLRAIILGQCEFYKYNSSQRVYVTPVF